MSGKKTIEAAFGAAVRETRKQRGISQEQLAFESDLDRSFISQIECGHKQPSIVTIFQIAKALGTTPAKLLGDTEQILNS
jgi:transcriptional regulator with XRE-family HTH domain